MRIWGIGLVMAFVGPLAFNAAAEDGAGVEETCMEGCRDKAAAKKAACLEKGGDAATCEALVAGWPRLCAAAYCVPETASSCRVRVSQAVRSCLEAKHDASVCRDVAAKERTACTGQSPVEPDSCEVQCGVEARESMPACVAATGDRKQCGLTARAEYATCVEACE